MAIDVKVNSVTVYLPTGAEAFHLGVNEVKDIHIEMNDTLVEYENGDVKLYVGFPLVVDGSLIEETEL